MIATPAEQDRRDKTVNAYEYSDTVRDYYINVISEGVETDISKLIAENRHIFRPPMSTEEAEDALNNGILDNEQREILTEMLDINYNSDVANDCTERISHMETMASLLALPRGQSVGDITLRYLIMSVEGSLDDQLAYGLEYYESEKLIKCQLQRLYKAIEAGTFGGFDYAKFFNCLQLNQYGLPFYVLGTCKRKNDDFIIITSNLFVDDAKCAVPLDEFESILNTFFKGRKWVKFINNDEIVIEHDIVSCSVAISDLPKFKLKGITTFVDDHYTKALFETFEHFQWQLLEAYWRKAEFAAVIMMLSIWEYNISELRKNLTEENRAEIQKALVDESIKLHYRLFCFRVNYSGMYSTQFAAHTTWNPREAIGLDTPTWVHHQIFEDIVSVLDSTSFFLKSDINLFLSTSLTLAELDSMLDIYSTHYYKLFKLYTTEPEVEEDEDEE